MCTELILALIYFLTIFLINYFLIKLIKISLINFKYLLKIEKMFQIFNFDAKKNLLYFLLKFNKKKETIIFLNYLNHYIVDNNDRLIIAHTYRFLSKNIGINLSENSYLKKFKKKFIFNKIYILLLEKQFLFS